MVVGLAQGFVCLNIVKLCNLNVEKKHSGKFDMVHLKMAPGRNRRFRLWKASFLGFMLNLESVGV